LNFTVVVQINRHQLARQLLVTALIAFMTAAIPITIIFGTVKLSQLFYDWFIW